MISYTDFDEFLKANETPISFVYYTEETRHLKVLLGNKLYKEYVDEVTRMLQSKAKTICENHWCSNLEEKDWESLNHNLFLKVSDLKNREVFSMVVIFEVNKKKDLEIEVSTIIA